MFIKSHLIYGASFALILSYFLELTWAPTLIIFLSSLLIDVDHYAYYAIKTKDFSFRRSYKWFVKKLENWRRLNQKEKAEQKIAVMAFHGIEFLSLLFILSFVYTSALWILAGVSFHLVLDHIHLIYHKDPVYAKVCPTYVYFTNKKKKASW